MGKSLIIVESPAKAKTINKFLGRKYVVKASMGHVRDLPKGKLGIDIEENFEPKYQTIRGRGKTIAALRKLAKTAEEVYLAPDPDREGEAIAWHLVHALKLEDATTYRVAFNEITKNAVKKAFEDPGKISMDKVYAQQARRILDRIVGYKLSPLLWEKIARGLSAGRVQSVAVRLIVEREREITKFKPEEYWTISAMLRKGTEGEPFQADCRKVSGKPVEISDKAGADAILEMLNNHPFIIEKVGRSKKSEKPLPPFSTSLMQQQASIHLRFSTRKTMLIAQQLYEGVDLGDEGSVGLITYMRTDSFRVANEALDDCRTLINDSFGDKYLPAKPNQYASRKGAQAAHEAIRPTNVALTPEKISAHLSKDQNKLYNLIWKRFVASQMTPALFDLTTLDIKAGELAFTARGKAMTFDGHTKVLGRERDKKNQALPLLQEGDILDRQSVDAVQHFTQPPPRFSEATLVKALEKKGIGRPSTYANIISTIQDRGYVKLQERKFFATELGDIVTVQLVDHFPKLIDTEFTSRMEDNLDGIEAGDQDWLDVLRDFYTLFDSDLEKARQNMTNLKKNPEPADRDCDQCGKPMVYKLNKRGRFIACSGYPDCKNTISIASKDEPERDKPIPTNETCEKCGSPMVIRSGRRGKFMACSAYPKCRNTVSVDANLKPVRPKTTDIECDKCGAPMAVKYSRRGPFLACSAFPKCRNAKSLPEELREEPKEIDKECPDCGKKLVIRRGRRGEFVACSSYPSCRFTDSAVPAAAESNDSADSKEEE